MSFIGQNGGGLELPIIDVKLEALTSDITSGQVVAVAANQKAFGSREETVFGYAKNAIASTVSIAGTNIGILAVAMEYVPAGQVGRFRIQGYVDATIDSGATIAAGVGLVADTDGELVATSASDATPGKVVAYALGSDTGKQRVLFSGLHGFGYTVTATAT
jgi:hypothetical protein